jgi:hypothetical protein
MAEVNNNAEINNNNNNQTQNFNVIATAPIKKLDVLNYKNIVECEDSLKAMNANQQNYPLSNWIRCIPIQVIIGTKFKFLHITDHQIWKEKDYPWLFSHLKKAFPENVQFASSDSLHDRIVALRPYFNSVQLNDETGVHIIIKNWWKSQIYHKQKI